MYDEEDKKETCCCHEHEHEHEHEHHHHHHHGGDEECCCHEHEHEHEHHHHHDEPKFPSVHIDTHDSAIIGTVNCKIEGTYEEALAEMQHRMQITAERIEEMGGLVGHIKAFAHEDGRGCMLSLTDCDDIQLKPCTGSGIIVEGANIVFGVSEEQLEELLEEIYLN